MTLKRINKGRDVSATESQHPANRELPFIGRLTKGEWKRGYHSEASKRKNKLSQIKRGLPLSCGFSLGATDAIDEAASRCKLLTLFRKFSFNLRYALLLSRVCHQFFPRVSFLSGSNFALKETALENSAQSAF